MKCWRRRDEAGQSLVEFAMVVPLLLLIVFAIVDFGRILQGHVSLTNAVREGARAGAVGASSGTVQARVTGTASGLSPTVSVTIPSKAGDSVVVDATATVQLITPLGAFMSLVGNGTMSNSFTLTAKADMRLE